MRRFDAEVLVAHKNMTFHIDPVSFTVDEPGMYSDPELDEMALQTWQDERPTSTCAHEDGERGGVLGTFLYTITPYGTDEDEGEDADER
jgi:hypothetical protein